MFLAIFKTLLGFKLLVTVTETCLKYPGAILVSKHGPPMVSLCDSFPKSERTDGKKVKFKKQNSSTQVIKHTKKGKKHK